MTPEERARLIERYRGSYSALLRALVPLGLAALDRAPEGEWTPRQIVHHVADMELFRSARLRVLLAEDAPLISSIDEPRYAEGLQYGRPIDAALALVRAAMDTNLELLDGLVEADWARSGVHAASGPYSVETWLERAAGHAIDHAAQISATFEASRPA